MQPFSQMVDVSSGSVQGYGAPQVYYGMASAQALGTVAAASNATFTMTMTGVLPTGSVCKVSPTSTLPGCLTCYAYVSANDTVTVVVVNGSAAGIAGGSPSFTVVVFQ